MISRALKTLTVLTLPLMLSGCLGTLWALTKEFAETMVAKLTASCWACSIVDFMMQYLDTIVAETQERLTGIALGLLAGGYAVWIGVRVFKAMGEMAFGGQSLSDSLWKDFVFRTACVMFAAILLAGGDGVRWVAETAVFSFLQMFCDLTTQLIGGLVGAYGADSSNVVIKTAQETIASCPRTGGATLAGLQATLECLLRAMQGLMMSGTALGFRLMGMEGIWPIVCGFVLIFMFVFFMVAFPFLVIDALFRLAMLLALIPVFIVAWAFPLTRHYAKNAFDQALATGVQILFTAMYMGFTTVMLYDWISRHKGYKTLMNNASTAALSDTAAKQLSSFSSSDGLEEAPMLILLILSFYVFRLSGKVSVMAGKIMGVELPDVVGAVWQGFITIVKTIVFAVVSFFTAGIGGAVLSAADDAMRRRNEKKKEKKREQDEKDGKTTSHSGGSGKSGGGKSGGTVGGGAAGGGGGSGNSGGDKS